MQSPTADVEPCVAGAPGRSYRARPKPNGRHPGITIDFPKTGHRSCPPGVAIPCAEAIGLFRGVLT